MQKMALEFGQVIPVPLSPHDSDGPEDFDIEGISFSDANGDKTTEMMLNHAGIQ